MGIYMGIYILAWLFSISQNKKKKEREKEIQYDGLIRIDRVKDDRQSKKKMLLK